MITGRNSPLGGVVNSCLLTIAVAVAFGVANLASAQGAPRRDTRLGAQAFAPCAACHNASGSFGPNLRGVMGRKAGARPDYRYSDAMRTSNIVWTDAALAAFLRKPQQVVRGTKMPFPGLSDEKRIAEIIVYLRMQK